jgi:hypothetical protein
MDILVTAISHATTILDITHATTILDITQINIMRPSILVAASTKEFGGSQRGHQCLPSQPTMGGGNRSVGEVAWQEESSSIR